MNRLLLIAALAVGVWYAWRKLRRSFGRFMRTTPQPKTGAAQPMTLERDPRTGVYRPPEA